MRKVKLAAVLDATGALACEACGFDFADSYGELAGGMVLEAGDARSGRLRRAVGCVSVQKWIDRTTAAAY